MHIGFILLDFMILTKIFGVFFSTTQPRKEMLDPSGFFCQNVAECTCIIIQRKPPFSRGHSGTCGREGGGTRDPALSPDVSSFRQRQAVSIAHRYITTSREWCFLPTQIVDCGLSCQRYSSGNPDIKVINWGGFFHYSPFTRSASFSWMCNPMHFPKLFRLIWRARVVSDMSADPRYIHDILFIFSKIHNQYHCQPTHQGREGICSLPSQIFGYESAEF